MIDVRYAVFQSLSADHSLVQSKGEGGGVSRTNVSRWKKRWRKTAANRPMSFLLRKILFQEWRERGKLRERREMEEHPRFIADKKGRRGLCDNGAYEKRGSKDRPAKQKKNAWERAIESG